MHAGGDEETLREAKKGSSTSSGCWYSEANEGLEQKIVREWQRITSETSAIEAEKVVNRRSG